MTSPRFDPQFYEAAIRLIEGRDGASGKSAAWVAGMIESVAWHLAGLPITPGRDRYTECPYPRGMAEYESYQSGWHAGKRECIATGIYTPGGPLWELDRPGGAGWIYIVAEPPGGDAYEYELTDGDGEIILRSNDGFSSPERALYAILKREIEG